MPRQPTHFTSALTSLLSLPHLRSCILRASLFDSHPVTVSIELFFDGKNLINPRAAVTSIIEMQLGEPFLMQIVLTGTIGAGYYGRSTVLPLTKFHLSRSRMSDFGYDIDDTGSGASGFSFGVMFSVTAFLLIIVILFACTRLCLNQPPRRSRAFRSTDQNSALRPTDRYPTTIRQGLDEATLNSYPKLLYTEIKKANSTASCCSICLLDYKETDVLRALPDCAHLFHLNCIDPWMRLHPTCPICRTAPVRVPVQLPSVEVVQLAAREAS